MSTAQIFVPILIVLLFALIFYSIKGIKAKVISTDELLRYFADYEELTAIELSRRIELRTGGNRKVTDNSLYESLEMLVKEGKLLQVRGPYSAGDGSIAIVRYSLPKSSL